MTVLLDQSEWLEHIRREYLDGYVRAGGAAVKFAVPCDGSMPASVLATLSTESSDRGYVVVTLDAAITRIHLADRLFFAIAEQVPWDELVIGVLARLARAEGFQM